MFSQQRPGVLERFGRRDFGGFWQRRFLADDRMAKLTIIAQHLAFPADVIAFVAAKTTGKERVANVIGMGAPIDFHFGKDIGLINLLHLPDPLLDGFSPRLINFWVFLQVK